MKKTLTYLLTAFAAALLSFSVVSAQANDQINDGLTITNPAAGATVGPVFTVTGSINSECTVYPYVFIYSQETQKNYVVPVVNRASGPSFSLRVNIAEAYNVDEYQNPQAEVPAAGMIDVTVASDIDNGCQHLLGNHSNTRTFDLQYSQVNPNPGQKPTLDSGVVEQVRPSPTPSATPTPTDSPTASPLPETKADYTLSPALAMLIGAAVGGTAVALAEYSARRYKGRRKRKR